MRVISKKTLVVFYQNFTQIRQTFNSADYVGNNRVVFNIKGNQYRLVTLVLFKIKMIYIRFIGTHKEYEKIKDIDNI